jgi:hypothetical protein
MGSHTTTIGVDSQQEQGEDGHISDLVVWMISCIDDLGSGWLKEEDKDV